MRTTDARQRQNVRWIAREQIPTVLLVDDQRGEYKRAFAATLVGMRAEAGISSQDVIARSVGVSAATYRRWEALDRPNLPNAWEISELCRVLDVEPDELVRPQRMSERERQLARRALRASRRGREAS